VTKILQILEQNVNLYIILIQNNKNQIYSNKVKEGLGYATDISSNWII